MRGGGILPLNLAPKPSKQPPWRIICNAIALNKYVSKWKCSYESLKSCGMIVSKGSWMFSVDLEDAYYSMWLQSESRGLFGAKVKMEPEMIERLQKAGLVPEGAVGSDGLCIQPKGLPMGFTNSCAIWTKISRVLTRMWRERGWKCIGYIDDFLFVASSEQEAWEMLRRVLKDIEWLGLAPSYKKTIVPTRRLKFLGILVDSELQRFFVPGEKVEKIKALARAVQVMDVASMRELASVAGKIVSISVAIPAARLLTKECYEMIRPKEWDFEEEVSITPELRAEMAELLLWIDQWNRKGAPMRRCLQMQEVRVVADAGTGWGYRLDGEHRGVVLTDASIAQAGEWEEDERELFQPWKELLVFEKMLEVEGDRLKGRAVLFLSDATAAVRYINKGSGPSSFMCAVMKRIFRRCVELELSVWAEHVSGEWMKDLEVDSLSRWSEFTVRKDVFNLFQRSARWGKYRGMQGYGMDRYASRKSAQCEVFCTQGAREGALGDARSHVCDVEVNHWVCPPLAILDKAVQQFWEQGVVGTVVVPDWTNAPWHLFLRERAVHSVLLPWRSKVPTMLDVAGKQQEKHGVDKWAFRAFLVDARCERGVREGGVLPSVRRLVLTERELEAEVLGVKLSNIRVERYLRVVDLFAGGGAVPALLDRMGVKHYTLEVEWDEAARKVARVNAPSAVEADEHDVWYWTSEEGLDRLVQLKPDLVVAGFPCQSVSSAAPKGKGLKGKSGAFEAVKVIVQRLQQRLAEKVDFLVECTDLSARHKEDFSYVSEQLGVQPVVLCASALSACYRKRAYWASFEVAQIDRVEVDPNSVLESGRVSLWDKLPTIVASGVQSWKTKEVVEQRGRKGPLRISEMERAMGYDVGYTDVEGLLLKDRMRVIGNAFHMGVLRHVMLHYVSSKCMKANVIAKNDVRAEGNPFTDLGDGPTGGESLGALGEWLSSSDDDCGGLGAWEDEDDCQHSVGASLLGPGCWHWGEQEQSRVPQQLLAGGRGSEKGKEGVGAKAVRARPAAVEQDGCCSGLDARLWPGVGRSIEVIFTGCAPALGSWYLRVASHADFIFPVKRTQGRAGEIVSCTFPRAAGPLPRGSPYSSPVAAPPPAGAPRREGRAFHGGFHATDCEARFLIDKNHFNQTCMPQKSHVHVSRLISTLRPPVGPWQVSRASESRGSPLAAVVLSPVACCAAVFSIRSVLLCPPHLLFAEIQVRSCGVA